MSDAQGVAQEGCLYKFYMIVTDLIPEPQFNWLTKINFSTHEACFCIIAVTTTITDKKFTDPCVPMQTTLEQPWQSLSLEFLR